MTASKTAANEVERNQAETFDPAQEALAAVHVGLWVSATRCVLTYVVAPAAGALGVFLGPIGLVLQILGAVTATAGAHRLWRLRHRARFCYLVLAAAVNLLVVTSLIPIVTDLSS